MASRLHSEELDALSYVVRLQQLVDQDTCRHQCSDGELALLTVHDS